MRHKQPNAECDPVSRQIKIREQKGVRTVLNKRRTDTATQRKCWLFFGCHINKPTIKRKFETIGEMQLQTEFSNTRADREVR